MATNTTNYQLIKPAGSEKYNISIFNDNWDIIDGKIKLNADNILKKQNTITGAATTVVSSNLTANRVIISNASGKFAVSAVTATELGYLSGAKSKIQTQIDNEVSARTSAVSTLQTNVDKKVSKAGDTMTGDLFLTGTVSRWIRIKRTDLDRSVEQTFPTSGTTYIGGFGVFDKTDNAMMSVNRSVNSTGVVATFQNSQFVNGAQRNSNINLIISPTGETYTTTSTVTNPASNNTSIATTAWVNSASTVVHTTGAETIAGVKTFTERIVQSAAYPQHIIIDTDGDTTAQPSSNQTPFYLQVQDGKGSAYCNLLTVTHRASDNAIVSSFGNSGRTWSGGIMVTTLPNNTEYATAPPTRSTGYTSKEIVTAGWADAKYVGLKGDQTIDGNKTYKLSIKIESTGERGITVKRTNKALGDSWGTYSHNMTYDMNDFLLGDDTVTNDSTTTINTIRSFNRDSEGNIVTSALKVVSHGTGEVYVTGPTPVRESDNSERIATTKWVNTASTVLHTTGNEVKSGTLTLKDGLVVNDKISAIQIQHSVIPLNGYPPETIQPTISLNDAGGKLRCNVCLGARVNDIHAMFRVYDTLGNWNDMGLKYDETVKRHVTFVPTPPTTGYVKNEIATVNWTDAKYVGLKGDQTISGAKTFTSNITKKQIDITKGSPSSSTIDALYRFEDSASDYVGGLRFTVGKAGDNGVSNTFVGLQNNFYRDIYARLYDNGTDAYMTCPTPSNASENSTQIATTAWVNKASTVVHSSGNETIAGVKKFTSRVDIDSQGLDIINQNMPVSSSTGQPSSYTARTIRYLDANGDMLAQLHQENIPTQSTIGMKVYRGEEVGIISITINDTSGIYALAPKTRTTGYTSNEIATAGWVDTKLAALETKINETRNYIISDTEPTSEDGEDGDIWFVYE